MTLALDVARWSVIVLLVTVLALASISDVRSRRIPNWTVVTVAVLFLPWIFVGPGVSILSSLEAAGVIFLISFALYAFGVIGAGDSKLLTVTALFAGLPHLVSFLVLVALVGGAVAVISLALDPTRALVVLQLRGRDSTGRGIPYGVAIAIAAAVVVVWPLSLKGLRWFWVDAGLL
jgi:prepilin peptidase CpaA